MGAVHLNPTARFRLRDATQALHHQIDDAFARFDLKDRAGYRGFLQAHARIVPVIERAVEAWGGWSGWAPRTSALFADIADLGDCAPAPAKPVEVTTKAAVWGFQYVLEGSKLGGGVLARQLGEGLPNRYLSGGHEPGTWREFQAELEQARSVGGSDWDDHATTAARTVFLMFRQAAGEESVDLSGH